ncbi:hypothetical protein ABZ897_59685, partial [Nonomuraea sp. NPDC046802]
MPRHPTKFDHSSCTKDRASAEARALGHGGIRTVAQAAGVREATVSLGVSELEAGEEPLGRVRR